MDLSKLSDKDLIALHGGKLSQVSDEGLHYYYNQVKQSEEAKKPQMSMGEVAKIKGQEGALMGFRPFVAGAAGAAGAGMGNLETTQGQPFTQRLSKAGSAAKDAFFDARNEATREQEIAQKSHPYIANAANFGGSILTTPLIAAKGLRGAVKVGTLAGIGNAASTADDLEGAASDIVTGGAIGAGTYGLAKGLGYGATKLGESRLGQEAKALGSTLLALPKKAAIKVANVLTGVPEKEIETYATQTEAVNKMIAESGGDITIAADTARGKLQSGIRSTRAKLSSQISEALSAAPTETTIPTANIIEKLNGFKSKLNPNTQAEAVGQIDEMIAVVSREGKNGLVNLKSLQDIKNFLQEKGQQAFLKGGQIFSNAKEAQIAAKQASTEALKILNPLAPEIANANKQLSQLHFIESNLNKNLIAPGKAEGALVAAGSGVNNRNSAMLKKLGDLSGQDALGEAERLAAAKRFGNPSFTPTDTTGKSVLRTLAGSAIGYGLGGPVGAAIGGALTSPAALKAAINVGQIPLGVVQNLLGKGKTINDQTVGKLYDYLKTDAGKGALIHLMNNRTEYSGPVRRIASEPNNKESNAVERRLKGR